MASCTKMPYRFLGATGLKVTFHDQLDVSLAAKLMQQCYDAGVNFFDNAEMYAEGHSEIVMGKAIKKLNLKRSNLVISTKLFFGGSGPNDVGTSRKHLIEGIKASLQRLELEYVDLVFCHRPDQATPMEETVRAMNWIINQGYAFYWGTSEWTAQQLTEAWGVAQRLNLIGPAMEQPQYHLLERTKVERDYLPLYSEYGLGTTIWSPLAFGLFSGKYSRDHIPEGSRLSMDKYKGIKESALVDEKLEKVDALKNTAEKLGGSLAQLALAWAAHNTNVSTVIMGATSEKQLAENLGSLHLLPKLTPEVLEEIEGIVKSKPEPVPSYNRTRL